MDDIIADVTEFLSDATKKWYMSHGMPHRRCFLFYGPPGTGKTSTVKAISTKFILTCCFLSMTNSSFSNQLLGDALRQMPKKNAMLILEDVDSLFNEDRKNEFTSNLTFSGMLNALDGVISADGVLTVLTTNRADRFDEALTRGGRVDRKFYFRPPSRNEVKKMFLAFYPNADDELAGKFAEEVFDWKDAKKARSMANLQELFVSLRKKSAEECVKQTKPFFQERFELENIPAEE